MVKQNKEKKSRQKKDRDAPKRAISAFFFYNKERREGLKKEQPNLTNKEIISTMSKEWQALSAKDKEKYDEMAKKDKARYEKEKAEYKSKTEANKSAQKKQKKKTGKKEENDSESK